MWRKNIKGLLALTLALIVSIGLVGCSKGAPKESRPTGASLFSRVTEVSPPATIQDLRPYLDVAQPQVKILSPRPNEVIADEQVAVRFQVKDLALFKNDEFGLGPHLHVILDDEPYRPVYDLAEPLILSDLKPGSHTLQVFASRPWHESFKNEGAYAQTTFHVYTQTAQRTLSPGAPLLTYSRPQGSYGAEPIMLDFYLTNAPLHLIAQERPDDNVSDWQIRCTVNGDSFTVNAWEPVYLKGFKPGKNWVKLELLDEKGNLFPGIFNSAVRLIDYTPGGQDALSKLVRGEIPVEVARQIVDPNYVPPAPVEPEPIEPEPEPTPVEIIAPEPPEPKVPEPPSLEQSEPEPINPEIAEPEPVVEEPPSVEPSLEPENLTLPELEESTEEAPILPPPVLKEEQESDGRSPSSSTAEPAPVQKAPKSFMDRFRKARPPQRSVVVPSPTAPVEPEISQPESTDSNEPEALPEVQPEPFSIDELITPSEESLPDLTAPSTEPEPLIPTEGQPAPRTFAPPTATRSRPSSPNVSPTIKSFLKRFQRSQTPSNTEIDQPADTVTPEGPEALEPSELEIPELLEAPSPGLD